MFQKLLAQPNWTLVKTSDEDIYNDYFQKHVDKFSYENNWAFIRQETRLFGVKYFDNENLLTIISKHSQSPFVFILPPLGSAKRFVSKIAKIARQLHETVGKRVVLRKASPESYIASLDKQFCEIVAYTTFTNSRDIPEDIYPQVIIDTLLSLECKGSHFVKVRNHIKSFTSNHDPVIKDLSPALVDDVIKLVKDWASHHEGRMKNNTSSLVTGDLIDPTAYTIFAEDFANKVDKSVYFSKLMYIDGSPFGFIFAGKTSPNSVALYSSICKIGYRGASEFLMMELLKELVKYKVKYLNLGGAETESLHNFKKKFYVHELRKTCEIEIKVL